MAKENHFIHSDLSYSIIGCAYDVYNTLGSGHKEKVYQNALALALKNKSIPFQEQFYYPVGYNGMIVGKNYFDFFIDQKIILELKASTRFSKQHFDQVLNYLRISNIELALLILFDRNEVRCKRIVNLQQNNICKSV